MSPRPPSASPKAACCPPSPCRATPATASIRDPTLGTFRTDQASVIGQITAPIYDGGTAASQTRQAKELTAQSRLVLDQVRNQARTAAVGAWVANEGAKIAVTASESEVRAATVALQGVQKEAQGGQRTTVDVLNSQADLISAKARLIGAQRDRVIASYTLLSAIGRLDVKTLALNTPDYLPEVHYHQVRDAWHGLRHAVGAIIFRRRCHAVLMIKPFDGLAAFISREPRAPASRALGRALADALAHPASRHRRLFLAADDTAVSKQARHRRAAAADARDVPAARRLGAERIARGSGATAHHPAFRSALRSS